MEYEKIEPSIQSVWAQFQQLETRLKKCDEGSSEFRDIYEQSMAEYKDQVQKGECKSNVSSARN